MRWTGVWAGVWAGIWAGVWAGVLVACLAVAPARADSLADVQSDMAALTRALDSLRLQLEVSRSDNPAFAGGVIDRIDAMERALRRMTSTTEELEFRLRQFDRDMRADLTALNVRLCQLAPDCAQVQAATNPDLDHGRSAPPRASADTVETQALAHAQALFVQGDGDGAGALSEAEMFIARFPASPLVAQAYLLKGQIAVESQQTELAARAFLAGYVADPTGDTAADSLYHLGVSFNDLGHHAQACGALTEVAEHFAGTPAADAADEAANRFGCL